MNEQGFVSMNEPGFASMNLLVSMKQIVGELLASARCALLASEADVTSQTRNPKPYTPTPKP